MAADAATVHTGFTAWARRAAGASPAPRWKAILMVDALERTQVEAGEDHDHVHHRGVRGHLRKCVCV
jgi:hypothetical protein